MGSSYAPCKHMHQHIRKHVINQIMLSNNMLSHIIIRLVDYCYLILGWSRFRFHTAQQEFQKIQRDSGQRHRSMHTCIERCTSWSVASIDASPSIERCLSAGCIERCTIASNYALSQRAAPSARIFEPWRNRFEFSSCGVDPEPRSDLEINLNKTLSFLWAQKTWSLAQFQQNKT